MKRLVKVCIAIIMCFGLFLVVNNRVKAEDNEDITKIYNETNLRTYLNATDLFMLGTGKLMNDITITGTDSLTVKSTKTLDLNGHTITIANKIGNEGSGYAVFDLYSNNPVADLTIKATNGGTINANGKGRLFNFFYSTTKLTIKGGTYINGVGYAADGTTLGNGGFVNINLTGTGSISIDNAIISNCSAFMGGAIYYTSSATPVNITNTVFKDNIVKEKTGSSPYAAGGAIYVTSYAPDMSMVLDNVTITGNKSEDYAAGIYVAGSQDVGSVLTLKGKINIIDNLEKGTGTEYNQQSNLYLTKGGDNVAHVKVNSLDDDSKIGTSVNDTHIIVKNGDGATASLVNNFINDYPNQIDFIYNNTDGLKTASALLDPACATSTAANSTCTIANEQQLRDWASNPNSEIVGKVSSNVGFNRTLTLTKIVNVAQTGNNGTKTLDLNGNAIKAADSYTGNALFDCVEESPGIPQQKSPSEVPFNVYFKNGTLDGNNKVRIFNVGKDTAQNLNQMGLIVNTFDIVGQNGAGDYGGFAYVQDSIMKINGTSNNPYTSIITNCSANGTDPYSYGGAILVEDTGEIEINNTKIYGNKSTNGVGGAIAMEANVNCNYYPNVKISNSLLESNEAYRAGGAIYNNGWNLTVIDSTITNNMVKNYKWSTYEYEGKGGGIFLSTRNLQYDDQGGQDHKANGLVVGGTVQIYNNIGKYLEGGNTIDFPNNVYINYEHEDYRRYIRQDSTQLTDSSIIGVSITDSKELRAQPKITVAKGFANKLNCFRFDYWRYGLALDSNNDINLDEITIYLAANGKAYKNEIDTNGYNEITTQLKYADYIEMYAGNIVYNNSRWEINDFDFSTSKKHTIQVEPNVTVFLNGNKTLENTSTDADHSVIYSTGELTLITSGGNPYTISDASKSDNGYGILTTGELKINGSVNTPINVNSSKGIGTKSSTVGLISGKLISRGGTQAIYVNSAIPTTNAFVKGSVEQGASVSSFDPAAFDTNTYKINNTIAKAISVDEDYGLYLDNNGKVRKNTSSGDVVQVPGISYNSTSKVWHFNNVKHSTHKDVALTFQDDAKVVLGGTNTISTYASNGKAIKVGDSIGHLLTIGNSSQSAYSYLNTYSNDTGISVKDLTIDNGAIVDVLSKGDAVVVEGTLTLGVNESPNHMYAEIHSESTGNNKIGLKADRLVKNNNDIYLIAKGSNAIKVDNSPSLSGIEVLGKTTQEGTADAVDYNTTTHTYQKSGAECIYIAMNAQNYSLYYEDGKIYPYDSAQQKGTELTPTVLKKFGIEISPDGKRIALKNFNFRTTNNLGLGIKSPDDESPVELIIDGVNSININEPTKEQSGAIYVDGNSSLVINGYNNATINATTAANAQNGCAAIYVPKGNLTINNANINATSRDTTGTAKSVAINAGNIDINSSHIVANSVDSSNGVAVLCDSLNIDDDSTLVASGKQYAIKFTDENGIKAKYIYGTDTMDGTPNKTVKVERASSETMLMTFASLENTKLGRMLRSANPTSPIYTFVLDDGFNTIAKKIGLNTYKPSPGPTPDPQPKDESCEKVLGPTWHWNNAKGICEDTGVVKTFSR